jgi:predicted ATPase/class 3 adenylate cyclase
MAPIACVERSYAMPARRAAIYCRVSTDSQLSGTSLTNQRDQCVDFAARNGWTVVAELIDEGVSGAVATRPALDDLLARCDRREVDVVVVAKLDRLGRSLRHLAALIGRLDELGANAGDDERGFGRASRCHAALFPRRRVLVWRADRGRTIDCVGSLPNGTVTFLFTDLEGSTRLWDEHPNAMSVALARHDEIVGDAISSHRGHVFSTGGDGVAAAFSRSVDALEAAVGLQRRLRAELWPDGLDLRVRVGIHTGEAEERNGDYFGPPLNLAARIMSAAHGGQIVVSRATAELLDRRTAVELIELGSFRLKGIREAVSLFGVMADALPWSGEPLAAAETRLGNLPRPMTDFVGRRVELQQKAPELLGRSLMTVTGTGGVGKTRFAIELGWLVVEEFVHGVWLVELAPVGDPDAVVAAFATTLSIPGQPGMTLLASVVDWLRGRRALLIVDNCEHVLSAAAEVVGAVLASCPTVTVVATSREPLGVPGERVHRVVGLDPAGEGVELFCARAAAADDAFSADQRDTATIATICRHLDGLPLAIELAAARVTSLSPQDVLDRLTDRFRLIHSSQRHGPGRHQTLRATVDWSYQLLLDQERLLLNRLSVFAGGFDLSAATAVCRDTTLVDVELVDLLGSLVDKSMVVVQRGEAGVQYRLLETLRQYAEERLVETGDNADMRDRHLRHFVDLAERTRQRWTSVHQPDADAIFERDWDNLRAAHAWAITSGRLDAADAIVAATGPHALCRVRHEHGDWAARTLDADGAGCDPSATAFGWAAYWTYAGGDAEHAVAVARRGIDVWGPDNADAVWCWSVLIAASLAAGDHITARTAAHYCVHAIATTSSDRFAVATLLAYLAEVAFVCDLPSIEPRVARLVSFAEQTGAPSILAWAAYYEGRVKLWVRQPRDSDGAIASYRRGLEWARVAGDVSHANVNLNGIVFATMELRGPEVCDVLQETISRFYDTRDWLKTGIALVALSSWLETVGNTEAATIILGHLDTHRTPWRNIDDRLTSLRGSRDHPDADMLIARGAAMDRDHLVAFALEQLTQPPPADKQLADS